jgi:hypothetical protein
MWPEHAPGLETLEHASIAPALFHCLICFAHFAVPEVDRIRAGDQQKILAAAWSTTK